MIPEVYHKCVDKTAFYTPAVMGDTPSIFFTLKHKEHALKKRLFAPSVSLIPENDSKMLKVAETELAENII